MRAGCERERQLGETKLVWGVRGAPVEASKMDGTNNATAMGHGARVGGWLPWGAALTQTSP